MTSRKIFKWLFWSGALAILIFALGIPGAIFVSGQSHVQTIEEIEPGTVLIFGAGLRSDGTPSDVLRDRLETGAELFSQGKATHILVSGDNRFENYNEPQVMHDVLVTEYEVPEDLIFIDFAGRRTYDTCIRAKTLWGVDSAILVTQSFHLPRAIWTCRRLGIESIGISASLHGYMKDGVYRVREILASYKAFLDVYVVEPEYLTGQVETDL
ncbi:MAG: hypothetical protein QG626_134 [Patescibacteria group bacterium]|jgi:vancomycin permeability regulator SanA|nr:hypothetical protein [Patescibacteria group bacterium]